MGNSKFFESTKSIIGFVVFALAGILATIYIANGSTIIGIIGGLVTVGLAFLGAVVANKWL